MKRIMMMGLMLLLGQISFANSTGQIFNVTVNGTTLTFIPKTNHAYPAVGVLITSPGYHFSTPTTQCTNWPRTEGYCQFAASRTVPGVVSITGLGGRMQFKLCLNLWGKLTCQNYSVNTAQDRCTAAGGKTVSGSNACWVKQAITVPTDILRCSTVCNDLGLALLQPGPINNATLAGKVCFAFGYTDTPVQTQPNPMTYIGNVTVLSPTSCVWDTGTGMDWDNPNNSDFSGVTGAYFCPCV